MVINKKQLLRRYSNPMPGIVFFGLLKNAMIVAVFIIGLYFSAIFSVSAASPGIVLNELNELSQSCTSDSKRNIELTWSSDIVGGPTYEILRKLSTENESAYALINSIVDNNELKKYTDSATHSDKNYNYKIKATKNSVTYYSNEILANAYYCAPVLYFLEPVCKANSPVNNLLWSGVTGDLLKYEILRKNVTAGDLVFVKTGEATGVNYSDSKNIIGTNDYEYKIRAIWKNSVSIESASSSISASACAPSLTVNSACGASSPGGPVANLFWNNLLGVSRYEIYRKAQSEGSYILLDTVTGSAIYNDNLVASLPFSYWSGGNISYFVKAVWVKDAVEISQSSLTQTQAISRCAPFVSVAGMCDAFNNPEMRLSWTKTMGADLYNLYRDGADFIKQLDGTENSFVDYLNSVTCPGSICTHSYRAEASVAGFPNFISNTASQSVDCITIIPPSPTPVLNNPSAYCESNKSKIALEWSPSDNAIYYTLYRNGAALINLSNTSYVDAGVESGISYNYFVRAYGKAGTSTSASDTKSITAVSCTPPVAPTLTLTKSCSVNMPQVNLSWSVTSAENIVNYEIKRGLAAGSLATKAIVDKSVYSKIDNDGINPSTAYYYQIIANSVIGVNPSFSSVKSITTDSCLPTTPAVTLSTYCESGNAKVKVSWTSDKANTDHFEIFRQDLNGGTIPIATVALGGTSYSWVDTNPTAQTTAYSYKVVAVGQLNTKTSTQGFKPITTYNCAIPSGFTLTNPPNIFCQGSYPRSGLNWSPSSNSTSYDLFRNRLNADDSVAETNTFINATSPYSDIGFGNALNFNGSSSVDFGLTSMPLTGDLTIEFWANPSSVSSPSRQNPICKSYGGEFCLTMEISGQLSYYHGSAGGNNSPYMSFNTPNVFENNKWVHVVITRNKATRTMKSYKNGSPASSGTWTSSYDPSVSTYNLFAGEGYVNNFKGLIDEVRIYNRVLSNTEALEHYGGIYSNESNLIGLWHFDEGSGQTVSNSFNNSNNGVLGASIAVDLEDPSWTSNGLQTGNKYNWQVRANGPGGVVLSNLTSSTVIPVCEPTKLGLEANTFCQGSVKSSVRLKWSYSINTDKYEIYRDSALIKTVYKADSEYLSRTWDDNNNGLGLNSGVSYSYYIKAVGPTGLTNQSNFRSVNALLCVPPDTISSLTATPSCSGSYPRVNLNWADIVNTDYYTVYRNGSPLTPNATISSFTDTTVAVNTYYTYQVTAYGPGGPSEPSNNAIIDPAVSLNNNYCTPSVPVITSVNGACTSGIPYNTVNWSDATTYNTQQYKIYRNTENNFSTATLTRTIDKSTEPALFNSRSWQNSGLLDDTVYYYWIKAIGPVGGLESAVSVVASRRTNICTLPSAPSISLSNICSSYNDPVTVLNWNKTANTTDYTIYKNTVLMKTINSNSNGYIKNWLIIGGFTYSHAGSTPTAAEINTALAADYLGGETSVKPRAGKIYGGKTWFEYSVPSSNLTDFTLTSAPMSALTPKTYASAYAFAYFYSPVAQSAQLRIGSDDGVKAFVNGAWVYTNATQRGASPDQDTKNINLIAGINTLLIKVQQGTSGWGLYARITDASGNDILNNITAWDSAAATGVSKDYNVSSIGPGGTSIPTSNMASSAPLNCNPLTPEVTLTSGCDGANTQMTVSWLADSNTYYWNIYKKRSTDVSFILLNPPGSIASSSYVDMNVASNVSYDYFVRAFGSGGITRTSDIQTALVLTCYNAPIKPVIATAPQCAGMTSRINIIWSPYDNTKTLSFNVLRKDITAGESGYANIFENLSPSSITEYSDGSVITGHTYSYRIEAVGSGVDNHAISDITPAGEGEAIDCLNTPPFDPPTLNLNFSAYTVVTGGSVSLRWTDTQNETKYKVFRRIKGETEFAYQKQNGWLDYLKSIFGKISNAAYDNPVVIMLAGVDYVDPPISGLVNYIDNTVSENRTYEYQILAINNAGGGDAGITYSNIISPVYVPIAPPVASVVSSAVFGPGKTRIHWVRPNPTLGNEYTNAGKPPLYEVQRSSTRDFIAGTFSVLGTICSDIINNGPARACGTEVLDAELEYIDNNASVAEKYYRVITENYGGRAASTSIVGYSNLKWKEVIPR
ncbi:MAG: LamG-like jellyroll fold domain-containing protein [bacterium]|nr:LamG-like jellyroll fold domain-containing protein [bacterium]